MADALLAGTPIIVVTIQTFPYAMEAIVTDKTLKGKNFAVIIDEAHNSQTGTTAAKLQTALAMSGKGKMASLTVEELLEQAAEVAGTSEQHQLLRLHRHAQALHADAVWPPD